MTTQPNPEPDAALVAALDLVRSHGYVAIKERSYQAAQTRLAVLRSQLEWEQQRVVGFEAYARGLGEETSRLRDRVEFVYGVARAHGATVEDLAGDPTVASQIAGAIERAGMVMPAATEHDRGVREGMRIAARISRSARGSDG